MIALVLLLLAGPSDAERLFTLGNALLAEGDAAGAVAAYEGAHATGWTSPALELNWSLAEVQTGRLGRAVLHAERAHHLDPDDADAAQTLRLLRERLDLTPTPLPPIQAAARWFADTVGSGLLVALAFALYLAALALVGLAVWNRTLPVPRRRALTVLVPTLLLVIAAAVGAAQWETAPRAVVVADEATVRSAPTPEAGQRGTVPEGTLLDVTERRDRWLGVRLADGTVGWASTDAVEAL